MELRGEKARGVRQLQSLLARGVITGGDGEELAHLTRTVFGAHALAFAQHFDFAAWSVVVDVPPAWLELHGRYRHQDPSAERLEHAPHGDTYLVDRDTTEAGKDIDLYFHLRGVGFRDVFIATMYNPFVSDLAFVLYREDGARPFSDADDDLFRLLYPHIAGALAARRALRAIQTPGNETLRDVLTQVDGYAHVSFPGAKVTWSPGARELWRSELGIEGDSGWARAERVVLASAAQFYTPGVGGRSQRVLPGVRIEWASVPPRRGERRRLLALMHRERAESPATSPIEALLTPRQRVIARHVVNGLSSPEIAVELKISVTTVRWTMREIYRRLRINSRAELAALFG